jgi:hypothetical protein
MTTSAVESLEPGEIPQLLLAGGLDKMDVGLGDWSKLRQSIQVEKNRELKDYKDMSKKSIKDAFFFLRQWALSTNRSGNSYPWTKLLQRLLWKEDEALAPVPEAKKTRYTRIVDMLTMKIQARYAEEFKSLSKFGGIPMVFRDQTQICSLFALVLVRNFRNDEKKVFRQVADTVVTAGIMDPCQAYMKDITMRLPDDVATDVFRFLEANSVGIGAERFVRRVAGAAAAAVLRGVDEGVIDLKVYPGVDEHMRTAFQKRMRAPLLPSEDEDLDRRQAKRVPDPTYGVARNAPQKSNENRITLVFEDPPAKVYAHVPVGIPMEEVMEYIKAAYSDVAAMLEGRGKIFGVYWQDPISLYSYNGYSFHGGERQWIKPDKHAERHASSGTLRSDEGIYVTVDALPIAELTNTVDFVTARRTMHKMLDALIDTPFAEGKTEFWLNIPNCQSHFEVKCFSIKPRIGLLVKYASFKEKLLYVISEMKMYADERLDLHSTKGKWYKMHSYMKGAELAFYRNVCKSFCRIVRVKSVKKSVK